MSKNLTITNELVEDIPLLLAQMERMGIQPASDEYFPTHGIGRGSASVGRVWPGCPTSFRRVTTGSITLGTGLRSDWRR